MIDSGTQASSGKDDELFNYRFGRLVEMGVPEDIANSVALNKYADLHQIERAINAGCPFDLVGEIWA